MRTIFVVLFTFNAILLLGQDPILINNGDSLIIKDDIATVDPLNLGSEPLNYFNSIADQITKLEVGTFPNYHVENKIDTLFNYSIGEDKFEVMKWSKERNAIHYAIINTDRFKTNQGISVGMKKDKIIQILDKYRIKEIPARLILHDIVVIEFFTFEFQDNELIRIQYQGYID